MLTKDDDVKIKQINLTAAQQINNNAQQLIEKCGKKTYVRIMTQNRKGNL